MLNICRVSDITGDADNVTTKIIECQSKIEQFIKRTVKPSASPSVVSDLHCVVIPLSTANSVSQARMSTLIQLCLTSSDTS